MADAQDKSNSASRPPASPGNRPDAPAVAMAKPSLGIRVLIAIAIGILVGFGLLFTVPVGVQPNDLLVATTSTGDILEVKIPEGPGPVQPEVVNAPDVFVRPVDILGRTPGDALALLSEATGPEGAPAISFTRVTVEERGVVTYRPWPSEILFIVGQIFLRLLQMLVVPLIISTVLIGIASLGNIRKLGTIGKQVALFYVSTMVLAVITGLIMVNLIRPGDGLNFPEATGAIAEQTPAELILRVIPTNPVAAIAQLDIVGMLFFVIIIALAMLKLGRRQAAPVFNFFQSLSGIVFILVGWVMTIAPIGVGALIAHTIATQETTFIVPLLASLGKFALTVVGGLLIHFIVLMVLLATIGKYNPITFIKKLAPAMAIAFGTNSSSATMPVTIGCTRNMGVSKRIGDFSVPVGATLNMDGTALFEAVAVLFFAQAFMVDLTVGQQAIVAVTSVVAAVGAAGIPSAGLVTMILVLSAVGLPATRVQLLWAIDRPLDMCRTVVNITGDAVGARVVQTWNPEIRPEDDHKFNDMDFDEFEEDESKEVVGVSPLQQSMDKPKDS